MNQTGAQRCGDVGRGHRRIGGEVEGAASASIDDGADRHGNVAGMDRGDGQRAIQGHYREHLEQTSGEVTGEGVTEQFGADSSLADEAGSKSGNGRRVRMRLLPLVDRPFRVDLADAVDRLLDA
ncbi:hypothetical protein W823_23265 [Williamsia sp. D3]|nr:hypothetical protein [Williamsia sp. D3]ETD30750.1 hypothetical protein W823_23265 [Williamsia sp. D3]